MKKWVLRIAAADRNIFEAIVAGEKSVETRAATARYRPVAAGDVLVFSCSGQTHERSVREVAIFPSIDELFAHVDFRLVMPGTSSLAEASATYDRFAGYREKIAKEGIIAFFLAAK